MDYDYTMSMIDKLPNIRNLINNGVVKSFRSVFPPDSIPSWITCYTGMDPSEHGILESINYLAKGSNRLNVDTSIFKGKTFWDIIGNSGKKVCLINQFLAYPVWPVNGLMVNGPIFIDGDVKVSNSAMVEGISIPSSIGGITEFATRKTLKKFVEKIFADTVEQLHFGITLLKKHRPDLFFQTFLTMDRIQHFLWRYCDKSDPTYPGKNAFQESIENFYIEMDSIIGCYLDVLESEDQIVVISDHGHGMRCTHCFNINEFLRKRGLLKSNADDKLFSIKLIIEKLKNSVLGFMNNHDLEDYISVVAQFIPNAKSLKKGEHITCTTKSKAYASDFTGTNPFGGVCINKNMVDDYDNFRELLIDELFSVKDNGTPIFQWIKKREEMFSGKYIERYPDVIFSINSQYGVNWSLHTKYFTVNPTHKIISGGHREYGVFFSNISQETIADENMITMNNFFSSVLDFFDIDAHEYSNSKSFFKFNQSTKM